MSTWLVTGASGFLGVNLGRWLGPRVRRVGLSRSAPPPGAFDFFRSVDLQDEAGTIAAIVDAHPQVIVHAAAYADHRACEADPDFAFSVNVGAARSVAEAAAMCGARLIHISTDAVFDGTVGDYRETDTPNPFSVYGETKLLGEQAVRNAHPAATVARTNFFGWSPSGSRSILEFFVNSLRAGRTVSGYTDFVVTSLYAQHLAELLFRIAATNQSGIVHVASSEALSKYDFGIAVARRFGLDEALITPASAERGPDGISRQRDLSLNTEVLSALLGSLPPSQMQGIDQALHDEADFS